MNKKIIILAVVGIMLISFQLSLSAAPGQKMMKHARFGLRMAEKNLFPSWMLLRHKEELGLTGDQTGKIEKMKELYSESVIRKQADIKVKELKFNTYLKKENINRGKMEKMIRDIAKMRTDMQIDRINYMLDVKNILTPEQIKKLEEFKKKRMHRRMDKRKNWRKERMEKRRQKRIRQRQPGEPDEGSTGV
ncbi:MAG: hypothetical protein GY950_10775 [bacterium]|nr:hypothetical protein [bacterium]